MLKRVHTLPIQLRGPKDQIGYETAENASNQAKFNRVRSVLRVPSKVLNEAIHSKARGQLCGEKPPKNLRKTNSRFRGSISIDLLRGSSIT